MAHSKGYQEFVLDDLKKYEGLTRPLKASLPERLLVRKMLTKRLHPNPKDEFSMPEIGPNYEIVQSYVEKLAPIMQPYSYRPAKPEEIDRLIVEKIKPHGYMLLNGHHRWLAACMVHLKTVPIKIVNITHEDEILEAMRRTENRICVSLDLDEVIITADGEKHTESLPGNPLRLLYPERIREGVPALIDALQHLGCDIWVYTGQYKSASAIRRHLSLYGIRVDGIVNGLKDRKPASRISEHFTERYDVSVHVDVEGIICVDTKNKSYDAVELVKGKTAWASEAISVIRDMETVKKALAKAPKGQEGTEK